VVGFDVRARVALDSELVEQGLLWSEKAHGEENELSGARFFGAGNFFGSELAFVVFLPLDLDADEFLHLAVVVADEFFDRGQVNARVGSEDSGGFLLAVVEAINFGPLGPWIVAGSIHGGLRQNLNLEK